MPSRTPEQEWQLAIMRKCREQLDARGVEGLTTINDIEGQGYTATICLRDQDLETPDFTYVEMDDGTQIPVTFEPYGPTRPIEPDSGEDS
jgi:hypothetical protein